MDYPVIERQGLDQKVPTALKLFAIIAAIWLLNVLFVAIHEGGHAAVAASFGSRIHEVYVSPTGLEGATTHDLLKDPAQRDVVLAMGAIATTLAIVVAYFIRLEIAVYVLGLRTIESLANYSAGSDMLALSRNIGPEAYLISIALIGLASLFIGLCVFKRISVSRSHGTATRPAGALPAPAA